MYFFGPCHEIIPCESTRDATLLAPALFATLPPGQVIPSRLLESAMQGADDNGRLGVAFVLKFIVGILVVMDDGRFSYEFVSGLALLPGFGFLAAPRAAFPLQVRMRSLVEFAMTWARNCDHLLGLDVHYFAIVILLAMY